MKSRSDIGALSASLLIGAFYSWVAIQFWGFYAANNPLNDWLLEALAAQGHVASYRAIISMHDLLVNVVIAIPFAALFVAFRLLNHWRNLTLAALSAVVIAYWGTRWSSLDVLVSLFSFWFGLALMLGSLPLAFTGLRFMQSRGLRPRQ